jgi:hypothetical protein
MAHLETRIGNYPEIEAEQRSTSMSTYNLSRQSRLDLKRFRNHLLTIPNAGQKFDMGRWAYSKKSKNNVIEELKEPSCNTAGCGLGHACTIPQFRRRGLELRYAHNDGTFWNFEPEYEDRNGVVWVGILAGKEFFGISLSAAEWLFRPASYNRWNPWKITVEMLVERIDYLLENDGSIPD